MPAQPSPIELVVLLDASGSMAVDAKRAVAVETLNQVVRRWQRLDAATASLALARVVIVAEGSPDGEPVALDRLAAHLDELDERGLLLPGGRGDLAGALARAASLAAPADGSRRALLLLSDGHDGALRSGPVGHWHARLAVAVGADADLDALRAFAGPDGIVVDPGACDGLAFALDALAGEGAGDDNAQPFAELGLPAAPTPARPDADVAAGTSATEEATPADRVGEADRPFEAGWGERSGTAVTDTSGITHFLRECLSAGGEGTIYRTRDQRVAVKVLRAENGSGERVAAVRRLPLGGLQIARPGVGLRGDEGYVMRLLTGMDSLDERRSSDPRRTLRVLGNLAGALAGLHARGLVHGDVKPANVLASRTAHRTLVWLIDADGIAHHGAPHERLAYTPGFDPPEGSLGEWHGDRFALAVLVHIVLSGRHPWLGTADGYDFWQEDWLREPGLARDATHERDGQGRPLAALADAGLRTLAEAAFGPGLADPAQRPTALQWAHALHAAADLLLTCQTAGCATSYHAAVRACPTCKLPRGRVTIVRLHRVTAGGAMPAPELPDARLALRRDEPVWISARHLRKTVPAGQEESALVDVRVGGSRLALRRTAAGARLRVVLRPALGSRPRERRPRRGPFGAPGTEAGALLGAGEATVVGVVGGPGLVSHAIVAEQGHT